MEVILLERVAKLGQMGEVVRVKDGYARNFLLPKGKALRATKDNRAKFEGMKAQLEATNLTAQGRRRKDRRQARRPSRSSCCVRRRMSVSCSARSPRATSPHLLTAGGFTVARGQIALNAPIKTIGRHAVPIALHPEVEAKISVNVARSADEAERLARGEDVTVSRDATAAEEAQVAAEAILRKSGTSQRGRRRGCQRMAAAQNHRDVGGRDDTAAAKVCLARWGGGGVVFGGRFGFRRWRGLDSGDSRPGVSAAGVQPAARTASGSSGRAPSPAVA